MGNYLFLSEKTTERAEIQFSDKEAIEEKLVKAFL
jgi:hypothetical protein